MSGVELLPFVWALPLTYFAASYGLTPKDDRGTPIQENLYLDSTEGECQRLEQNTSFEADDLIKDEAIELTWDQRTTLCDCFMA